jgi:hypothetical protein
MTKVFLSQDDGAIDLARRGLFERVSGPCNIDERTW